MKRYYIISAISTLFVCFTAVTAYSQTGGHISEVGRDMKKTIVNNKTESNNSASANITTEVADERNRKYNANDTAKSIDRKLVEKAIVRQMTDYPQSTLQDLYKSFFQDRFGAGHIIADRQSAENYIRRETETAKKFDGEMAEPAGWRGNFVRVNLSLVKEGQIGASTLADALMRSSKGDTISIDEWKNEWHCIEQIITELNPGLPQLERQHNLIEQTLSSGNYVMHHSDIYNNACERHYRIIRTEIWQNELLPSFQQGQ